MGINANPPPVSPDNGHMREIPQQDVDHELKQIKQESTSRQAIITQIVALAADIFAAFFHEPGYQPGSQMVTNLTPEKEGTEQTSEKPNRRSVSQIHNKELDREGHMSVPEQNDSWLQGISSIPKAELERTHTSLKDQRQRLEEELGPASIDDQRFQSINEQIATTQQELARREGIHQNIQSSDVAKEVHTTAEAVLNDFAAKLMDKHGLSEQDANSVKDWLESGITLNLHNIENFKNVDSSQNLEDSVNSFQDHLKSDLMNRSIQEMPFRGQNTEWTGRVNTLRIASDFVNQLGNAIKKNDTIDSILAPPLPPRGDVETPPPPLPPRGDAETPPPPLPPRGDVEAAPPLPPRGDAETPPPPLPPRGDVETTPPPLPPRGDVEAAPPPLPPRGDVDAVPPPLPPRGDVETPPAAPPTEPSTPPPAPIAPGEPGYVRPAPPAGSPPPVTLPATTPSILSTTKNVRDTARIVLSQDDLAFIVSASSDEEDVGFDNDDSWLDELPDIEHQKQVKKESTGQGAVSQEALRKRASEFIYKAELINPKNEETESEISDEEWGD